jgi:two-component system, NtrC family, response regulator HydG
MEEPEYNKGMDLLKESFAKLSGGPRILLVDDDENDLLSAKRELANFVCTIVESPSIEHAIKALDTERIDLVLCDLKFPHAPATDLISRITQRNLAVEFMALTGFPKSPFADDIAKMGAFRVVPKPVSPEFLGRFLARK